MLNKGQARKVTIFVNEDAKYHHTPIHEAILQYLLHKGVSGATATRAMAGFGPHHEIHSAKSETLIEHLPIRIEFIETVDTVNAILPTLYEMVSDGLIEVQDTTIIKAVMKEAQPEPKLQHEKQQGPAKLMRIYLSEADQWEGEPLYEAIVKRFRMIDIAGATVYRGILGFGATGETHKEHFLHISSDLPILITVVDTPEKVAQAIEIAESMMNEGTIVTSDVDMIRLVRANPINS